MVDFNADGVFDNATERTSIMVPAGSDPSLFYLTFPVVPKGYTGTTYARFRLSTDTAAANPTGAASDGEVEDYRIQITAPSSGIVDGSKTVKIARGLNGGPTGDFAYFGQSMTSVGDLDGDGVGDLVADGYVLFMNPDGTVRTNQHIDYDGNVVAAFGDLDGNGVTDLAVGGWFGLSIVELNADGTVKRSQLIADDIGPISITGVGDLDGDGIDDIAVGIESENQFGEYDSGASYTFLLNQDGSIKAYQLIASDIGGAPHLAEDDLFGNAVTSLGDIDGDGIPDMAVAAIGDTTGSTDNYTRMGAVYVLFMNDDGTAKSVHKIADQVGGGPQLDKYTDFGASISSLGDIDGDGITDIAVGAIYDRFEGDERGAIYEIMLNADGTAKRSIKIASSTNGGPMLSSGDRFGSSIASLGDLNGDGITDIAVGAYGDDTGGWRSGAVYVMFLKSAQTAADYNVDHSVDAADYIMWRKTFGNSAPTSTGADGNGNGTVDEADYALWRNNFRTVTSANATSSRGYFVSSEEPTTVIETAVAPGTGRSRFSRSQSAGLTIRATGSVLDEQQTQQDPGDKALLDTRSAATSAQAAALLEWLTMFSVPTHAKTYPKLFEDIWTCDESPDSCCSLNRAFDAAITSLENVWAAGSPLGSA